MHQVVADMVHVAKLVPVFTIFGHISSESAIVFDWLCELLGGSQVEIDSVLW